MISFVVVGTISISAFSQTNVENFDYPTSTLLTDVSIGFTEKSNTPSISIHSSGLSYSGLAVSEIGKAAHINISEDEDADPLTYGPERIARKPFFASSVSTGTVYLSFLANIKSTLGGDFNNFFIAVSDFNSDNLRGRVMAKDDGAGKVMFGFTKGYDTNINWTSTSYDYNSTYLFVVKYEFISGTNNDVASLFVFEQSNDGVPTNEPVAPTLIANDNTGSDLANIKIVHLRQRKVETVVDGIALGTSWSDVVVEDVSMSTPLSNNNQVDVKIFQSTDNKLNISLNGIPTAEEKKLKIYNLNGQLLLNTSAKNENKFTLETNNKLTKGIYVLNLSTSKSNYNKKFVVK